MAKNELMPDDLNPVSRVPRPESRVPSPVSRDERFPEIHPALDAHARVHLAAYKVPRDVVLVNEVLRSPSGKPDYTWAASIVNAGAEPGAGTGSPSASEVGTGAQP